MLYSKVTQLYIYIFFFIFFSIIVYYRILSIIPCEKGMLLVCFYLCIYIYLFVYFGRESRGIPVPQPVIKPVPPAVGAWSPNHWTASQAIPASMLLNPSNTFLISDTEFCSSKMFIWFFFLNRFISVEIFCATYRVHFFSIFLMY